MTLIVGVLCGDGAVIGSDGVASFAVPISNQHTITQPSAKLTKVDGRAILGVSGPVGISQSFHDALSAHCTTRKAQAFGSSHGDGTKKIQDILWPIADAEFKKANSLGFLAQTAVLASTSSSVIAFGSTDGPCLIQFDYKASPERATQHLPFVAIGSGQQTAEPFLAFIRRTFWRDKQPTVEDGIFATLWTLDYSIKSGQPGIGEPIQLMTLRRDGDKWTVSEMSKDDLGVQLQIVRSVSDKLPSFVESIFSETNPPSIPTPTPSA